MSAWGAAAARRTRALSASRPMPGASPRPGAVGRVASVAGQTRGDMGRWQVHRQLPSSQALDRLTAVSRAEDLVANDSHARSLTDSMALNTVGVGLRPQSQIPHERLDISEVQAEKVQRDMEWAWYLWNRRAHAAGRASFNGLMGLAVHQMLALGEYLFVSRFVERPDARFLFCLQDLHPLRLSTPADKMLDPSIRDGVEIGSLGESVAYWIADPAPFFGQVWSPGLTSADYSRVAAGAGNARLVWHSFPYKEPESVRGRSILEPCLRSFKLLHDALDYELVGQILAAAFALFIETDDPSGMARSLAEDGSPSKPQDAYGRSLAAIAPGTIAYGQPGQTPHVLESNRPGSNFDAFAMIIMRSMAAAAGMPYEVLTKDFSKTNYSSARAALLEAHKVFKSHRYWLQEQFCEPVWRMVMEEAVLRGLVILPKGAPDFWTATDEWTRTTWIGPARGYVDPVKEITAQVLGMQHNILTLADVVAEQGGDWESVVRQRAKEARFMTELGVPQSPDAPPPIPPDEPGQPGTDRPGQDKNDAAGGDT